LPHGLWFPVDVSTASRATIGGMAGNNSCGGRSLRYGTMRDNTLSMDAALADGTLLRFGEVPRDRNGKPSGVLLLLRHKVLYFARFLIEAAQQGHRRKCLTRTRTSRRRMVAIEFGMCRSGRSGGSSGSVTFGNASRLEHRGGTRC